MREVDERALEFLRKAVEIADFIVTWDASVPWLDSDEVFTALSWNDQQATYLSNLDADSNIICLLERDGLIEVEGITTHRAGWAGPGSISNYRFAPTQEALDRFSMWH